VLPRRSQFGGYPEERDPDPLARALRRPMGEPSLPPAAFDHLSRERQLGLLWRLAGPMAGYLDRDDAIEYVAHLSPTPCAPPRTLAARITAGAAARLGAPGHGEAVRSREAVPGSDGRYHLRVGDVIVCGEGQSPGGPVQHTDFCWWCTDGKTYRVQEFPADGPGQLGHGTREVSWLVTFTGATKDPALVPPRERCPVYVGPDQWPRFHGGKKGKLVVALVGALGSDCHACGDVTGSFIDHDHFTGYVRGLLCKGCNHIVDMCPHPSGCVYAGYLNDPPASPLRLKYPMDRTLKERRKRMAALGISSFDELWTRRRQR
jgi:Recombination endonuclease VII